MQVHSNAYRKPGQLPQGAVLVVGAGSSGVQIADELQRAGRDVIVAVGNHTRAPRTYRGVDIFRWFELMGDLDRGLSGPGDPRTSEPSLQLVGRAAGEDLDLGTLQDAGVRLTGRLYSITRDRFRFGADLESNLSAADERLRRLLARIDAFITTHDLRDVGDREVTRGITAPAAPATIDAGRRGIHSVVWATGFSRSYPWLHLPVFDRRGEISHHRGVTVLPGCYTMGMRFQTRRGSTFIDGVRFDAAEIARHLRCATRVDHPNAFAAIAS
jgi:putative flavoprotein involved in K+ transport